MTKYEDLVKQGRFVVAISTIGERYATIVTAEAHRIGSDEVPSSQLMQQAVVNMLKAMQRNYTLDVESLADMDGIAMVQSINDAMNHMTPNARFSPGYCADWATPRIAV